MRYDIELLKADILDELKKLQQLTEELAEVESKLNLPAEEVSSFERGAIGYILHNFYNGCENIFKSIARFFENDLSPQTWHQDLLKRMRLEVAGIRPQVINHELFRLLDDFRGFRHVFRHSYMFELDWERERLVARKLPQAFELIRRQLQSFLDQLDKIVRDGD